VTDRRLDTWLPDPAVRTHHRASAAASPDDVWDAARSVRLADTRTLGRVVRWRIPGLPADATFDGLLRAYPFTVLEEDEHLLLSGLCGRIWTLQRDYPRLASPEDFRYWDERGTVRVLFANWLESDGDRRTTLVAEARVAPVDQTAGLRLRALWTVLGRFERLIGAEALNAAMRRAEAR